MKTIKQILIEKISQIILNGNFEDIEGIKQEINDIIEKETDISKHLFYNPLLHEKYNTLEMLEGRKQKYLKEFQAYVEATKEEYGSETYGKAKEIAVGKLIGELSSKTSQLVENSSKEGKLYLDIKLALFFFAKYINSTASKEFEELMNNGLFCKSEYIKSFLYNNYYKGK